MYATMVPSSVKRPSGASSVVHEPPPASLPRRVVLALGVALLSVIVAATALLWAGVAHSQRLGAESRVDGWLEVGAAMVASAEAAKESLVARVDGSDLVARKAEPERERFQVWAKAVLSSPVVMQAELLNAEGATVAMWPPTATDAEEASRVAGGMSDLQRLERVVSQGAGARPKWKLAITYFPWGDGVSYRAAGAATCGLVFFAVVGFAMCIRYLRQDVAEPLAFLATADESSLANMLARQANESPAMAMVAARWLDLLGQVEQAEHRLLFAERVQSDAVSRRTAKLQRELRQAERGAYTDSLTRLANRRFLEERLEKLLLEDPPQGCAIIALDLDNFKAMNDTRGHAAGDELLRFVGELLRSSLRESDVGLRLGGDEFAVVLPGALIETAHEIAERLVKLFRQRASTLNVQPPVSLSAGVAATSAVPIDLQGVMAAADAALYNAKRRGKNTVAALQTMPENLSTTRR